MPERPSSPRILELSWGRMVVEGLPKPLKDAKLWPGGAREWDWNETGTRHLPGIQLTDVDELLDSGARTIVLSRGIHERLQVMPATLTALADLGIEVHVLQTEEAVGKYNALTTETPVGALIHSTC